MAPKGQSNVRAQNIIVTVVSDSKPSGAKKTAPKPNALTAEMRTAVGHGSNAEGRLIMNDLMTELNLDEEMKALMLTLSDKQQKQAARTGGQASSLAVTTALSVVPEGSTTEQESTIAYAALKAGHASANRQMAATLDKRVAVRQALLE